MRLSTKGRYAIMAMVDIARYASGDQHISLTTISQRNNISVSYLEQLFIKLKKQNLVSSSKGAKGGYKLSREASCIYILEIVNAVDERIDFLRCSGGIKGCVNHGRCNSHDLWDNIMNHINSYLSSISLESVVFKEPLLERKVEA